MSELTARLAIYGSIDRAVVEGRLPAEAVAVHLGPYQPSSTEESGSGPSAAGWYDALLEILNADPDGPTLMPPVDALAELAGTELEDVIDAEHRFRALFLQRRLLTEPGAPPDDPFVAALQQVVTCGPGQEDVREPEAATRRLIRMMDDRERFDGRDGYVRLAAAAGDAGLLSAMTAQVATATCKEGTVYFASPDGTDVAAEITSDVQVTVPDRSVAELRLLFHPGRWPKCLPTFWGAMDPLPPPPAGPSPSVDPGTAEFMYREHVGDQKNGSTWFSPVLGFCYTVRMGGPATQRTPVGFLMEYGLAKSLPAGEKQDTRLLLDDGYLLVTRTSGPGGSMTVNATTYKTLAMDARLPGPGLAIFACVSGWADQAKALVTGCLLNP